jgi:hypothetical protein
VSLALEVAGCFGDLAGQSFEFPILFMQFQSQVLQKILLLIELVLKLAVILNGIFAG